MHSIWVKERGKVYRKSREIATNKMEQCTGLPNGQETRYWHLLNKNWVSFRIGTSWPTDIVRHSCLCSFAFFWLFKEQKAKIEIFRSRTTFLIMKSICLSVSWSIANILRVVILLLSSDFHSTNHLNAYWISNRAYGTLVYINGTLHSCMRIHEYQDLLLFVLLNFWFHLLLLFFIFLVCCFFFFWLN